MDSILRGGLNLLRKEVRVRGAMEKNNYINVRGNDLCIDASRISSCPDEAYVIQAIEKRIGRNEALKSRKYSTQVCIMLLLSVRYCVNSSTLNDVPDEFVERCWECVYVASHNVREEALKWMKDCIGSRSIGSYATKFCSPKVRDKDVQYLGFNMDLGRELNLVSISDECNIPEEMWHRDDVPLRTLMFHQRLLR